MRIFDQFKRRPGRSKKKNQPWLEQLKNHVSDIFDNIKEKQQSTGFQLFTPVTSELKFKLDKEALNVTKRYTMDLEKSWIIFTWPFEFAWKNKAVGA